MSVVFNVYSSTPSPTPGGSIDFTSPIATITTPPWTYTSPAITPGSTVRYAVYAYDTVTALENPDAASTVTVTTAADGSDPLLCPPAPTSVTASPTLGGGASVGWTVGGVARARWPVGFRVFAGPAGGVVDFGTVLADVPARPYDGLAKSSYVANISGLADGVGYVVAVVGYNTAGQGAASGTATVVGSTVGPDAVVGAVASVTGMVDR